MAVALLVVAALYYAAMNVFVGTRMFRDAISYDPDALRVEYDRAYSLLPGRIHVDNLRIRGRDSSVEWLLALDRCEFTVSFTDLLRRRFHASRVDGDGLSLRLRRRKDQVTAEAMSATPLIPGFLDPPLSDVGPPLTPLTDASYHLWSVFLDGVRARHVREIWIDTVRYSGDLLIQGSWFFRPLRWLDVGPALIDMHTLDVSFGEVEPWVQGASGALDVTVHPTDLVATQGSELIDHISVLGAVSGAMEASNVLGRALPETRWAHARTTFSARVELDHGVVRPLTYLSVDAFEALAGADGFSFAGRTRVAGDVDARGLASVRAEVGGVRVRRGATLLASAPDVAVRVVTRALDLGHLPSGSLAYAIDELAVDAPGVDLPSLAALAVVVHLPNGLSVEEGRGHADVTADFDVAGGSGRGQAGVTVDGLRAHFAGQAFAGSARLVLHASDRGGPIDVSGSSVTFHADPDAKTDGWWGGAELLQGTLRGLRAPHLRARIELRAKDASPLAALVVSKTPIPKLVVGAISTADFQATADIVASPSLVEAKSVQAHCSGLDGRFEYVLEKDDAQWALWLNLGLVRAAAYEANGSTEVALFGTEPWFADRVARLRAVERAAE